jgi:hypothetical protein
MKENGIGGTWGRLEMGTKFHSGSLTGRRKLGTYKTEILEKN